MLAPQDRRLPRLNRIELHQTNFFLGLFLAFISLFPVVYLSIPVLGYYVFALLVMLVAAIVPEVRLRMPVQLWTAIPLLIFLAFLADFVLIAGIDGAMEALTRLIILLVCYCAVAFRNRRKDLQLILLCLFLVIIVGVNVVSVLFILQIGVFAAISMFLMFNINLLDNSDRDETPDMIWEGFSWRHYLGRLWESANIRIFGLTAALFVLIMLLSAGIFLLIPRLGLENRLGFLGIRNTSSISGFSEDIGLSDITNILHDTRTALRIDPPSRDAIPADPYWRMLVLDRYRRGRFSVSDGLAFTREQLSNNRFTISDLSWVDDGSSAATDGEWLFYMEPGVSRWLPLPGDFASLRTKSRNRFYSIPAFRVMGQQNVNSQFLFYEVTGLAFMDRFPDRLITLEEWEPTDERFSSLIPESFGNGNLYRALTLDLPMNELDLEYLQEVVEEITGGRTLSAEEFVVRAKAYLAENHGYSLTSRVPRDARGNWTDWSERSDRIVRWLRSGSDGHCEYFAGALLVLSRAAGHPARIATGFRGGTWNSYENYLMVRYSDAHAWCEIYDGDGYWFRADPTPHSGEAEWDEADDMYSRFGISMDSSWNAYLDSLRVLWYRRIVSFDDDSQRDLLSTIRENFAILLEGTAEGFSQAGAAAKNWVRGPWDGSRFLNLGAGILILGLFVFLMRWLGWRVFPYLTFYRKGVRLDPVRRQAGKLLLRLDVMGGERVERLPASIEEVGSVRLQLQTLRYGAPETRKSPGMAFRRARSVLKRMRRA